MPLVSKRTRYALHGLAYIAAHPRGVPIPFDEILTYLRDYSSELTLSPTYIAKLFQQVSRAGLVQAVSGPHGGYRLARPPQEIALIEVVEALDGPLLTGCCLLSVGTCTRQDVCGVRKVIHEAELKFHQYFTQENLASMARRMVFGPAKGGKTAAGTRKTPGKKRRSVPARASVSGRSRTAARGKTRRPRSAAGAKPRRS